MDAPVIEVLPDPVIDQIAAGEVVERPASVVKELVENALDAGARTITVDVEAGGRALIRVADDGVGMAPDDAGRALLRHATSKLRAVDDLWTIGTMGFRGEALPSIASVSRLTLTTRRRDDLAATRIEVEAGRVVDVTEAGAPPGTTVEVRDLLHNVPARLKFLKGEATESSHVTEAVSRLAMTHPHVHFRLRHGGRTVVDCTPAAPVGDVADGIGLERARALLGGRLAERLHAVTGEEGGVRVIALLGAPSLAQSTSRGVQLYVGRRFVRDRGLLHAVTMGFGELVPRGRYPVAIVMVDVDRDGPQRVDVNVHPQKLEVRFSDAGAVQAAVRHVVRRGVAAAPWLGEAAGAAPVQMHAVASMGPPLDAPARPERASDLAGRYARDTTRALFPMGGLARPSQQERLPVPVRAAEGSGPSRWVAEVRARMAARGAAAAEAEATAASGATASAPSGDAGELVAATPAPEFFGRLRYLGQLDRTFLVCEAAGELVLIDQHAAHERVEFQRLRERTTGNDIPVQRLLFPQTLEVTTEQAAVVEDAADVLASVGFEVEPFGGGTVAVKAVPAGLRHEPSGVLRELLADLADHGGSRAVEERFDHVLATVACHSVVRAGDLLSPREAEALLASMDGVDFRAHCPHGRPVLLRMAVSEIARRLGR
ncbi:MAG: DNA mismatch repair endonuclease MutL [Kofleriaceae bacterium]|nr:DNA mismatch repair endonuclease MutL [Kofleriaceae bacterium]